MARITLYPTWENNSGMRNINGNTGIYREMEDIQALHDTTLIAHWGNQDPGANYAFAVASINGGKYKPSGIEVWNFHVLDHIPANAHIRQIKVEWSYAKFAYPNMGHGSFGQPVISIPSLGLFAPGNAPPKDVMTDYSVTFDNLKFRGSDLADVRVTMDVPMNTANNPAYIKMNYLRLNIEYEIANYIPTVGFQRQPIQYGEDSLVTIEVIDANDVFSSSTTEVTVVVAPGLSIVPGSIDAQGTYNPNQQKWMAKLQGGRARLTFRVTPTSPSISGYKNVNAYCYIPEESRYNSSVESIYITPQKAELVECSVSENAIKQSLESRHYTLFTLTVQNNARTPLTVHLDLDKLKINGSIPGYDSSTKTLTITNWDGNNLFDIQVQLYSTELEDSQIICYSNAWTGVTLKSDL